MRPWRASSPAAEERPGPPRWDTREELRIAIVTWIERTYHRRRRQTGLGRLTPIEFEAIMTTPASQAA
jgi:transposase InsO family protein